MTSQTNTIHLKENLFISIGNAIPKRAKALINGSLAFMSDDESKWYVQEVAERFYDYCSKIEKSNSFHSAKASLRSAIESLIGKGKDADKVKFKIYRVY